MPTPKPTWNGWPCEDGSNYNATAERRRGIFLWVVCIGAALGLAIAAWMNP